ncbi:hypothetical protein OROHE_027308 [Orobanche hederae]
MTTMECRNLEITLVSADNLPNILYFGRRMKVYAEVNLLNGESQTSKRTAVDMVGETNPRWDFTLQYTINEADVVRESKLEVVVKLYCERTLRDLYVGEVKILVKSFFDSGLMGAVNELSYGVDGTPEGRLNMLYSFGDMFSVEKPSIWTKAMEAGAVVLKRGAWMVVAGVWRHREQVRRRMFR